jgi:signal transduction histidine kinase
MHAAAFTSHAHEGGSHAYEGLGQTELALAAALATCLLLGLALHLSLNRGDTVGSHAGGTAPGRRSAYHFAALITASILVPLAVFTLAAWQNWKHLDAIAEDRARKRVSLIAEHALKVFQSNEQVLRRVDGELRGLEPAQARGSFALNSYLNSLVEDIEHLDGIGFIAPDGRLVAVSQGFPAPLLDLSGADYFVNAARHVRRSYVSVPSLGHVHSKPFFRLSRHRTWADERSAGVVYASMSPDYFLKFYQSVTGGEDAVTMIRSDGTVLVRDPPVTTGARALSPGSGLMRGVQVSDSGIYRTLSELDSTTRIHAFQRVGLYPVYVSYGLSLASVKREWLSNIIAFGVVAGLAAVALSSLSLFALRRADQERLTFKRWQEESERRELAEDALRQSQKMEAVGQLTGGIAHDFNNLLTVVVGNLDFATRALERGNTSKAHRNIEAALHGAQRAAALTHRLLAFSRRQPLQPQVVNLNAIVSGMSNLFRRSLGQSIRVETVLASDLWNTLADPNQLESALLNLVINARDAMPAGGRLTLTTANCAVGAGRGAAGEGIEPGAYVTISVEDTGTGMTEDVMERAFEPFFTTKDVGQGTGLGLSMIYGFVKQSGGHVQIHSTPGVGTKVTIILPRTLQAAAAGDAPARPIAKARRRETILAVEDDPQVRAYAVETLRSLGYRVLEADDAASALSLIQARPDIDVLFTDVGLPGLNGRQLADEVWRRRPDLPVLFTTGHAAEAIGEDGTVDPELHLLNKPFTVEQLAEKVRQVLDGSHRPKVAEAESRGFV